MKLDTKQTVKVGFAFLSICTFWQMYNSVIPLMLTNTFHLNESISGIIMASDNVLALFLLPLFGGFSDRCSWKMGKRKPFIMFGTLAAIVFMLFLPILDNAFYAEQSAGKELLFIIVLGCLLVAMGTYRSPAVALMPDVTPKPLRSKGNAVINLMGAVGGVLSLLVASVLYSTSRTEGKAHIDYLPLFAVVAGIMLISMLVVVFLVDEAKLNREMLAYEAKHPEENLMKQDETGHEVVPKEVKKSLFFLLMSIALWFMGYNAVETWFTTYANSVWNMSLGSASACMTVATAGAILSYIPAGQAASRIGRRKSIMAGVLLLSVCFFACFVYTCFSDSFHYILYLLFFLLGMAWAFINVNSLPMVLEMCKGSEVGKFTGLYYTFSMTAQIVTPILVGTLLNRVSYKVLFPYCTVFVSASFVTMLFVKHGDNKVEAKRGLEAFDVED